MPVNYGDLECSAYMIAKQEAEADADPDTEESLTELLRSVELAMEDATNDLEYQRLEIEREQIRRELAGMAGDSEDNIWSDQDRVEYD